jgi:hypothetical protein
LFLINSSAACGSTKSSCASRSSSLSEALISAPLNRVGFRMLSGGTIAECAACNTDFTLGGVVLCSFEVGARVGAELKKCSRWKGGYSAHADDVRLNAHLQVKHPNGFNPLSLCVCGQQSSKAGRLHCKISRGSKIVCAIYALMRDMITAWLAKLCDIRCLHSTE